MLLRRRPAAVNLGQTKYFHRSSGVPLSVRRLVGREMGKNCLLPYMEMSFYLFSNILHQIMPISLFLSLLWRVNILTDCIISLICPPFSHFSLMFVNSLTGFFWRFHEPLPLPGSLAHPPVACDWQMRLGSCVLTHTSLVLGLWSLYQATSLWTFWHMLSCSHMHVSYPRFIFSH